MLFFFFFKCRAKQVIKGNYQRLEMRKPKFRGKQALKIMFTWGGGQGMGCVPHCVIRTWVFNGKHHDPHLKSEALLRAGIAKRQHP